MLGLFRLGLFLSQDRVGVRATGPLSLINSGR